MASDAVERLLAEVAALPAPRVRAAETSEFYWQCAWCSKGLGSSHLKDSRDHAPNCPWRQLQEAAAAVRASESRDVWVVGMTNAVGTTRELSHLSEPVAMHLYETVHDAVGLGCEQRPDLTIVCAEYTHYRAYPVTEEPPS